MREDRKNSKSNLPNLLMSGCMFIGIGLGFVFGQIPAGTMIGMGVGMIVRGALIAGDTRGEYEANQDIKKTFIHQSKQLKWQNKVNLIHSQMQW